MSKPLRKKRGPKPTGKGKQVQVRLQPPQLAALDSWIKTQPGPRPTRPEAIRRLVDVGLAVRAEARKLPPRAR